MRMTTTSENIFYLRRKKDYILEKKRKLREEYLEERRKLNIELREIEKDIDYENN